MPSKVGPLALATALLIPCSALKAEAIRAFIPQPIVEALLARGVSPQELERHYATLAKTLGGAFELHLKRYTWDPRFQADLGRLLARRPEIVGRFAAAIRDLPPKAGYLSERMQFTRVFEDLPAGQLDRLQKLAGAYARAKEVTAAVETGAAAGAEEPALLTRIVQVAGRLRGSLGQAVEASAQSTAFQLTGYLAIAGATQAAIQTCLASYEAEMSAVGNAAEAQAYNRLVEMLLIRLHAGTVEVPGHGSLADGLKLLRQNLQTGRPPFTGFVSRREREREESLKEKEAEKYCIWTNDVGWLHVGTLGDWAAERRRPRRDEIWGGRATEPLKAARWDGTDYASKDEAVQAVGRAVDKAVYKKAPLATPAGYYVGKANGKEWMLGFEIVRHPAFKPYLP